MSPFKNKFWIFFNLKNFKLNRSHYSERREKHLRGKLCSSSQLLFFPIRYTSSQLIQGGSVRRSFSGCKLSLYLHSSRLPTYISPYMAAMHLWTSAVELFVSVRLPLPWWTGASDFSLPIYTHISWNFKLVSHLATSAFWWFSRKVENVKFVILLLLLIGGNVLFLDL